MKLIKSKQSKSLSKNPGPTQGAWLRRPWHSKPVTPERQLGRSYLRIIITNNPVSLRNLLGSGRGRGIPSHGRGGVCWGKATVLIGSLTNSSIDTRRSVDAFSTSRSRRVSFPDRSLFHTSRHRVPTLLLLAPRRRRVFDDVFSHNVPALRRAFTKRWFGRVVRLERDLARRPLPRTLLGLVVVCRLGARVVGKSVSQGQSEARQEGGGGGLVTWRGQCVTVGEVLCRRQLPAKLGRLKPLQQTHSSPCPFQFYAFFFQLQQNKVLGLYFIH